MSSVRCLARRRAPNAGRRLLLPAVLLGLLFAPAPPSLAQRVPRTGTVRALVVFARFADDTNVLNACDPRSREWADPDRLPAVAESLLAPTDAPPFPERSLTDYFHRQSNGVFTLVGAVYPDVLVTRGPASAYRDSYSSRQLEQAILTKEILRRIDADPRIDLSDFDANRDGYLDQIFIVLRRGMGLQLPGNASGVSSLGYGSDVPEFGANPRALKRADGASSGVYALYQTPGNIFPEVNLVRLLAHEFGHNLFQTTVLGINNHLHPLGMQTGTPGGHSDRIGYALMVGGMGTGDVSGDETLSAYERWLLDAGWIACTTLAADTTVAVADLYTGTDQNCYILRIPNSTLEPRRLFLSNRQRVGFFDRLRTNTCTTPANQHGLRTTGLLAMLTHPQTGKHIAVLPADNTLELHWNARPYQGDLFGPDTRTQLTPWTTPSINGFTTYPPGFWMQDGHFQAVDRIRYTGGPDGEMAFDYIADFRLRPVIREDSRIGAETAGYTFTGPVVVTDGSTLTIGTDLTFADTLHITAGSTVVLEPGAAVAITESGRLIIETGARMIANDLFRNDGWAELSPGAKFDGRGSSPGNESAGDEPTATARTDDPQPFAVDLSVFPNPFRGTATFAYALDGSGPVRLHVFDAVGRMQAALIDERQPAGAHRVVWEAPATLANGVYLARLEAGRAVQTRTLVLAR